MTAPSSWPEWHLRWEEAPADRRRTQRLSADEALINLKPAGQVRADFGSRTSTFLLPAEPSPEAWTHPHLSVTAVLAARWLGRRSFHSGAFVAGDGAWGVLGDRGQGKTSTLAWLASHGYPVVCDDILVLDGGTAFAGPRCLDLRETAARHFHMGSYIGRVGTRAAGAPGSDPSPRKCHCEAGSSRHGLTRCPPSRYQQRRGWQDCWPSGR